LEEKVENVIKYKNCCTSEVVRSELLVDFQSYLKQEETKSLAAQEKQKRFSETMRLLMLMKVLPIDENISKVRAEIFYYLKKKKQKLEKIEKNNNDIWIAATCIVGNYIYATSDQKICTKLESIKKEDVMQNFKYEIW
jgi:predicted nucleic acid-binding protein